MLPFGGIDDDRWATVIIGHFLSVQSFIIHFEQSGNRDKQDSDQQKD